MFLPTMLAQFKITQPPGAGIPANKFGGDANASLGGLISNIITILFIVGGIAVVIMVVLGAVQYILAGGDKEGLQKARNRIVHALIGLALLALSFVIIQTIGLLVGFNPLNPYLSIPTIGGN